MSNACQYANILHRCYRTPTIFNGQGKEDMADRPIICVGDKTDHGGVVIEGSPFDDIDGRRIARVGDKVTCPLKGHGETTVIVTGDPTCEFDGKAVARHGDKTACGATLLASQTLTTDEAGTASGGTGSTENGASRQANRASQLPPDSPDEQVRAVDATTGEPIANLAYFIEAPDGATYSGRTDANGLCERIATRDPAELTVWFGDDAEKKQRA